MSAYDECKKTLREAIAYVPYEYKYVRSQMQDPTCPQLRPIMANETEVLHFAGQVLYDIDVVEKWAKAFMLWKGSEAERKRLEREEHRKSFEAAQAKVEREIAAHKEQVAMLRADEQARCERVAENQEAAFKRAGVDPEGWHAEQARLRARGM